MCVAFQTKVTYALSDQSNETARELNKKGVDLIGLGKYMEAIQNFDKALAIEPNDQVVLANKGFALYSLGNYSRAIEYYDKALAIDPKYATVISDRYSSRRKKIMNHLHILIRVYPLDHNDIESLNGKVVVIANQAR